MKKEDYLKMLNENEIYKEVLSKTTNSTERRIISAYAEDFIVKFFKDFVGPAQKAIEKDPDVLNKVYSEIEKDLLNTNSGSQDQHNVDTT
jgi:hypothetical protein